LVEHGGRLHIETLLTVVGAIAGFSAQHAIWETIVKPGKMPAVDPDNLERGAFVQMQTKSGEVFYFGNLLNSYIFPASKEVAPYWPGQYTLCNYLAFRVARCGGRPIDREQLGDILRNAVGTIGTPQFGLPRLPEDHTPSITPRDAVNRFWSSVRQILSRDDAAAIAGVRRRLSPAHWPAVVAMLAAEYIETYKDVLEPALSVRIILEAAIPMSNVDPKTVPQEVRSN
jgi:hypothetical protein